MFISNLRSSFFIKLVFACCANRNVEVTKTKNCQLLSSEIDIEHFEKYRLKNCVEHFADVKMARVTTAQSVNGRPKS